MVRYAVANAPYACYTDVNGNTLHYEYDEVGNLVAKFGVMTEGNGLYYMRARFYSPEMKRFVNQDVLLGHLSEGQTLNRYAFVTGRPISSIDPTGNITWFIPPLIGLFLTVYDIVIPPTLPEGLEGDAIVPSVGPGDLLSTGIPLVSSLVKGVGVCNELASGGRILQKWPWGYKNITETQAEAAYAAIRDSKTDVNAIASYLHLNERSAERLRKIKDYLFNNSEWTGADPAIVTAWQRLRTGRATAEDVLLLKHEVAEIWLRQNTSLAREEAHRRANKHYNWEFTVNDMEFWE